MTRIGTVGELRRYPIKSMLGETLERAEVRTRGLSGDRVCALIDAETGRVASAKMPRRWRRLLECAATYRDDSGAVAILTPDGRRLDPADVGASDTLSALVERPVKFAFARDEALQLERANPEELAAGGDENGPGKTVIQIGMGRRRAVLRRVSDPLHHDGESQARRRGCNRQGAGADAVSPEHHDRQRRPRRIRRERMGRRADLYRPGFAPARGLSDAPMRRAHAGSRRDCARSAADRGDRQAQQGDAVGGRPPQQVVWSFSKWMT